MVCEKKIDLAGFCRPDSGTVKISKHTQRRPMGVCPYTDYLYPELTPKEHLLLYGGLRETDLKIIKDEATVLLDIVYLLHRGKDRCKTLSFAQKRLISLLTALVGRPG
jgi:ABC-type multidrug transport system ATPase subunit